MARTPERKTMARGSPTSDVLSTWSSCSAWRSKEEQGLKMMLSEQTAEVVPFCDDRSVPCDVWRSVQKVIAGGCLRRTLICQMLMSRGSFPCKEGFD